MMTWWRATLLLLIVGIAACGKPKVAEPAVLDLPAGVNVQALVGETRPREVLASLAASESSDARHRSYSQRRISLEFDDTGLWRLETVFTQPDGGSGSTRQLSLCGLAILQNDSSSTTPIVVSNPVVVGRTTIPMTVTRSNDRVTQWQAKSFTTTAKHICMPEPGETFTYHLEVDVRVTATYQKPTAESVADVTCHVDTMVRPATQFAASLRGDALAVSCERTNGTAGVIKNEYAFLRDSAFYLLLQHSLLSTTVITHYDAATYRP